MYNDKVVAAIKVNGKVLREIGDTVTLPFGCEYSVLLKNLNSVRTQVNVSVDGDMAAERLVIGPNSSLELERYIRNGNLQSGNKFKFIERNAAVEGHRGIGADDGLVRVESWRELVLIPTPIYDYYTPVYPPVYPYWYPRWTRYTQSSGLRSCNEVISCNLAQSSSNTQSTSDFIESATNDAGITVPGSYSTQQFHTVSGFPLEAQSTVIVLRLRGGVAGVRVSKPLTVAAKPTCITCGKKGKGGAQFCAHCGTALSIL